MFSLFGVCRLHSRRQPMKTLKNWQKVKCHLFEILDMIAVIDFFQHFVILFSLFPISWRIFCVEKVQSGIGEK